MGERSFIVKYVAVKDSFLYVSNKTKSFDIGTYIKVTYGHNRVGYFSVNHCSVDIGHDAIGFASLHAKTLGIKEDDIVSVMQLSTLPNINSLTIAPLTKNDYEVLELLAEEVQNTLLKQIKVVHLGQVFVIWIGETISVAVCTENISPASPGQLEFLTEVHVNPTLDSASKTRIVEKNERKRREVNFANMAWIRHIVNTDGEHKNDLKNFYNFKQNVVYRVVPVSVIPDLDLGKYNKIFDAIIPKTNVPADWPKDSLATPIYSSVTLLTDDVFSPKVIYVRLIYAEDIKVDYNSPSYKYNIYVNENILDYFECRIGARVVLQLMYILPVVKAIEIKCKKNHLVNVVNTFKEYLAKFSDDSWVLNKNFTLDIGDNIVCELDLQPTGSEFCIVDDNFLRNCEYYLHEENVTTKFKKKERIRDDFCDESIGPYHSIVEKCLKIHSNSSSSAENILVIGKPGTGKSSLLRILSRKLQNHPHVKFVAWINCKNIKGKTMDSLLKVFLNTFSELVLHQPSILMLDDLNVLCERSKGEETAPNNIYFDRISELLHNLLKFFCTKYQIGVCATAHSIDQINKNIYSSRGSHLFKNVYIIHELTKDDRLHLIKELFSKYILENIDFEELACKTEGFVVQDLVDFSNKAIFDAVKCDSSDSETLKISQANCESALKNTCVLALQNVNLHSPGDKDFSDIGGLGDVKTALIESLSWPAKYPTVFSNAPLRLQSGLLLYGPPGTGKTVLAAAAAKQCGLRLISVKGPELLSKYIGASEQAVRDVFQKAQSVRPCILFFDEFDSLAPRRGHDNTGVTDRVVNQLLTQLDGVEALTGVCVLAATSRPDLLDPALLRPGRLDRQILCDLPSKNDRLNILKALSKNLDLYFDVNFEQIADKTANFSGADLQSLLYTAQLATVELILKDDQDSTTFDSVITQEHLESALKKTKPSLSRQERLKYQRIYQKFQSGTTLEDFEAGTKATLA